jgi:hypothetical protein
MSDERAAVGSICDSRLKCFRGCQYKLSYIILLTGMTLCIAGDIARGGKALSSFSASLQAGVLARECHHQVILPQKRSLANEMSRRIKPGRARVRRRRRAFHVDDIARCGRWRMATAGGADAKLMHPSIQRICWLDGIGGGRAPHTAHVAYGSRATKLTLSTTSPLLP